MSSSAMFKKKGAFSWALYDWGNSAFATTVVAGFFPVFFKKYWSIGADPTTSTAILGYSVSVASLIVAVSAPILGSLADRGSRKKLLLFIAAAFGIAMTAGFFFVGKGNWELAALMYVMAYVGWLGSIVFYDALIVSVSDEDNVDKLSGFGFALGYLGGGVLFLVNVLMFLQPAMFGLVDGALVPIAKAIEGGQTAFADIATQVAALGPQHAGIKEAFAAATLSEKELFALVTDPVDTAGALAVRLSFLSVAIWWAVFSIPMFLRVDEEKTGENISLAAAAVDGFKQLIHTLSEIRKMKWVLVFLLAYWFYIDGVDTIIVMAVDYGLSIGFADSDLITGLLLVQFVGFPFAWLFGWLGQKFGPKPLLLVGVGFYLIITVVGANLSTEPYPIFGQEVPLFYVLVLMIGMVQGGVQALSRSLYTRLIPLDKAAEFFGFYNMLGKFAAIIGPTLMGTVGLVTGDPRMGIQSIAVLFLLGGTILFFVNVKEGEKMAREL